MRLKILACEIVYREVCYLVALSPHRCDIEFLPKGLHDLGVEKMRPRLQESVDAVPEKTYDAILLVYGLCNNGIVGLQSRHTRIVVPRAHDCIALFMGDRRRYLEYFNAHPGTYYRTTGWLERGDGSDVGETISQKLGRFKEYEELVRKYGEDNAKYLLETMGDLTQHYDRLTYIRMGLSGEEPFSLQARREAEEKGWTFEEIRGSMELLRKMLWGEWGDDVLILQPGQSVKASYDEGVIRVAD